MRRIILALLLTALMATMSSTGEARAKAIGEDRGAIGGIAIGSRTDYVRSIYGEPTRTRRGDDGSVEWYYGDSFQMRFVDGRAVFVCSSGNNGLNMPDEIGVGMKGSRAKKVFGRPSETLKFDARKVLVYDGAGAWQLIFVINGKWITEIRLAAVD